MKAHEIRAIPQEYSEKEQKAHTDVLREIINAQKRGNTETTTKILFGYPRIRRRLTKDGFTVSFDNGRRLWLPDVDAHFTVSWRYDTNDNDFYP